jgi:hypothetical protein
MGGNHQNWVFHRGKTPWVFQPSAGSEVPQWPSGQWRLRTRRGQGETEVGKDQNLWVPIGIPYIYTYIYRHNRKYRHAFDIATITIAIFEKR